MVFVVILGFLRDFRTDWESENIVISDGGMPGVSFMCFRANSIAAASAWKTLLLGFKLTFPIVEVLYDE